MLFVNIEPRCGGCSTCRLNYKKGYPMSHAGDEPTKRESRVEIRRVEFSTASEEIKKRLPETQAAIRRLEEAKVVPQEIMKLEVSV